MYILELEHGPHDKKTFRRILLVRTNSIADVAYTEFMVKVAHLSAAPSYMGRYCGMPGEISL